MPIVFDVRKSTRRHLVTGAVIGAVLGVPALVSGVVGLFADDPPVVGLAVMIVLGLLLSAMPVITIARWKVMQRPHQLVVEQPGIRWDDPRGAPWAVRWSELDIVMVHGELTHDGVPLVCLRLHPGDPHFAARHPEMAHLVDPFSERGVYRVSLTIDDTFVPRLDDALTTFAPDTYVGSVLSGKDGVLIPAGTRYPGVREPQGS
jgi:hypothetical protein